MHASSAWLQGHIDQCHELLGGPYSSTGFRAIPSVFPGAVVVYAVLTQLSRIFQNPSQTVQKNIGLIQYLLHLLGIHATIIPHIMPTRREWGKLKFGAGVQHSVVAKAR